MSDIVHDDYCYKDDHVDDCHIIIYVYYHVYYFRLILSKGADVNSISGQGYTPLHMVGQRHHP